MASMRDYETVEATHGPLPPLKATGTREAFGARPACRGVWHVRKAGASSPHSKRWRAEPQAKQVHGRDQVAKNAELSNLNH
jgi:hypothetical protein